MHRLIIAVGALAVTAACAADGKAPPLRQISASYGFEIAPDLSPPHAREPINYKVTIIDRKTHQPVENGEGRLFASDSAGQKTWDGFRYGPEIGTYRAVLHFITPGLWAVAIQFRRDTLSPVERIDWYQDVHNERPSTRTPTPR
jgi:hypothetical protein